MREYHGVAAAFGNDKVADFLSAFSPFRGMPVMTRSVWEKAAAFE